MPRITPVAIGLSLVLSMQACATNEPQKPGDRYGHFVIVSNVIDMTWTVPQICESAPQRVREGLAKEIEVFRQAYPELIRLSEESSVLEDAKKRNQQFLEKTKARNRSAKDIEDGCYQSWNYQTYFNKYNQKTAEKWIEELRKPLPPISNPPLQRHASPQGGSRP